MENWLITKEKHEYVYSDERVYIPEEQYLFIGTEEEAKEIVRKKNDVILAPHIKGEKEHLERAKEELEEARNIEKSESDVLEQHRLKLISIYENKVKAIERKLERLQKNGIYHLDDGGWDYEKLDTLDKNGEVA